ITMPKALVLKNTFCSNGLQYFSNNSDLADRLGEQKIDGIVIPIIAAFAAERFNMDQDGIQADVRLTENDINAITYCIIASIN
ncbi:MAG: hypothetical protein NT124_00035, partial [Candidatus Dependentiae bacterium]|nr:hypothetical protein [Candidatus Dependentiae bacterium]